MPLPPIVALEIGTSKVVALVGEVRQDGHIMITGMGEHESRGLRKAQVTDLENAVICTRAAVQAAEESARVTVRQVHMVASGGHIQSHINRGSHPIISGDGVIEAEDADQVMEVARALNLPADREILHTICQYFQVDDQERIASPEGMEGARLSVDMLILHGKRNVLRNTVRVARSIQMDVHDIAFGGLCSALAVLDDAQRSSGALVIDVGGGSTDYLAYADDVVLAAGTIGVGGDHVTNDIALAFNIPTAQAEDLKCKHGSALVDPLATAKRISLPAGVGFGGKSVSLKALHTVMNARIAETVRLVKAQIEEDRLLHRMGMGVVLTGGGAHTPAITDLVEKEFELPCTIGRPRNVSGLATVTEGPQYASAVGMIEYALITADAPDEQASVGGWLSRLFGAVR